MALPQSFVNEIISQDDDKTVIRSNIKTIADCDKWIQEYGQITYTNWIVRSSLPDGNKIVCS